MARHIPESLLRRFANSFHEFHQREPGIVADSVRGRMRRAEAHLNQSVLDRLKPEESPTAIFYLVHGTWGQFSKWLLPNSMLLQQIREVMQEKCIFVRHYWGAQNSHAARLRAAETLQATMRSWIDRYPNSCHFVIGHSHGGNVALYALRDATLTSRINGFIGISVPYIHVRARRHSLALVGWVCSLWIVTIAFLLATLVGIIGIWSDCAATKGPAGAATAVSFFYLICAVVALAFARALTEWTDELNWRIKERQKAVCERLGLPPLRNLWMFGVSAVNDEVLRFLQLVNVVTTLPFTLMVLSMTAGLVGTVIAICLGNLAYAFCWILGSAVGLLVLLPLLAIIAHAFALLRCNGLAFGESVRESICTRVYIGFKPPCKSKWTSHQCIIKIGFSLAHSAIYNDCAASGSLIRWILKRHHAHELLVREISSSPEGVIGTG